MCVYVYIYGIHSYFIVNNRVYDLTNILLLLNLKIVT